MDPLLTQREVCALIRISYPTLARWLTAGTFPKPVNSRGKGRKLLWTQSVIEQWMNQQSTPSNAKAPLDSRSAKREVKAFEERQKKASQALDRHRKAK